MAARKPPIVVMIAFVATVAGGSASDVFNPNIDPETKALLKRQGEVAEQKTAARTDAAKRANHFLNASPEDYPRRDARRGPFAGATTEDLNHAHFDPL